MYNVLRNNLITSILLLYSQAHIPGELCNKDSKNEILSRSSILEQDGCVVYLGKGGWSFLFFVFLICNSFCLYHVVIPFVTFTRQGHL